MGLRKFIVAWKDMLMLPFLAQQHQSFKKTVCTPLISGLPEPFGEKMGRRKKSSKPPPKRKVIQPLDILFNCPFCNHEKSCEVKMDRERNTGFITCTVCMEDYQTTINYLTEPIDVYGDWIDACESANQ